MLNDLKHLWEVKEGYRHERDLKIKPEDVTVSESIHVWFSYKNNSTTRVWMTVIGLSTAPLALSLMDTGLLNCVVPALNVLAVRAVQTQSVGFMSPHVQM